MLAPVDLNIMYTADDQETAKIGDRIIAAVIAGLCGYFVGWLVAIMVVSFFGGGQWLSWLFVVGFSIFGFIAPSRSRAIWSHFWEELLGFMSSRK